MQVECAFLSTKVQWDNDQNAEVRAILRSQALQSASYRRVKKVDNDLSMRSQMVSLGWRRSTRRGKGQAKNGFPLPTMRKARNANLSF